MKKYDYRWLAGLTLFLLIGLVCAGTWTPNQFIYKPSLGARGQTEYNQFNTGMERVDSHLGKQKTLGDPGYSTLAEALATIGSIKVTLTIPAGTVSINSDTTIPSNVHVRALQGGVFSVADGKTLTINGTIEAGLYQIFSWAGTGKVRFGQNAAKALYPEWWGAVGDGVTDDLAALNACIAVIKASGGYMTGICPIILSRWYAVSDTLSFNEIKGPKLVVQGKGDYDSGIIGLINGYPVMEVVGGYGCEFRDFAVIGKKQVGSLPRPTDGPSVGIFMARDATDKVGSGHRFDRIQVRGYFQYGALYNVCVEVVNYNQCRFAPGPVDGANDHLAFIIFTGAVNTYSLQPRNTSMDTTVQSATMYHVNQCELYADWVNLYSSHPGFAIFHLQGVINFNVRDTYIEGTCDYTIKANDCLGNSFRNLVGDHTATVTNIAVTSTNPGTNSRDCEFFSVAGSGPGSLFTMDANTSIYNYKLGGNCTSYSSVTLNGTAYDSSFDLYNNRKFIATNYIRNCYIRVGFNCQQFDLPSGSAEHNIIQDGRYNINRTRITGNLGIKSKYGDYRSNPNESPNIFADDFTLTWRDAVPTTGSWRKGSVIFKAEPAAGGSAGWVCTDSGTFGTLNSGNTTGSITINTKVLTVNTITGLNVGNIIDVTGAGTRFVVREIDAANNKVYLSDNASATVTGAAVSFHNNPVFTAMANLAP